MKHVLSFQDRREMYPERAAWVVLFFDAQEYLSVTEFMWGPVPKTRAPSMLGIQTHV